MIGPSLHGFQPTAPRKSLPGTVPPTWDLVRLWARTGPRQMAVDHALAEAVWAGRRPPTLRLYGWHAPGLTIGRLQHPAALPAPAVRRFTGGRAVFHQDELTLSLALPAGHPLIAPTIRATYRNVMAPVVAALHGLGLPAGRPPAATRERATDRTACFSAPTDEEAEVEGRKVVALAQRISPRGLLVQASIPLAPPTAFDGPDAADVAGLRHFLPGLSWPELAEAVREGFSAALGVGFRPTPLTRREHRRAAVLAAGPYAPTTAP